ncbi:Hsp20 family protein [Parvibaculum sp.]|jgi:molecular chaperone IbpA|uniref:Hsp20 family protein n=1 Tax=Parvibaculum sp. TaxID=2024848 RepID=UPI000C358892|nr:Hsp20 family protein [Parvibaculum sp.]MAM94815.1 molecular chaperone [Parvibaculum sp.]HCX67654.1 molecular chaperone [Rhodobiaceae bacterium]|tara:strand:- start:13797 stop:14273 length:477 start_codon:yes stop_codon:yes gene_type:complete
MRGFDFSPLYRSTVGFDQLQSLLDSVTQETAPTYPPYNIERTSENDYRITLAVAGFAQDDLNIEVKQNVLTISGKRAENEETTYLHRGIAGRSFERRFQLADHVEVSGAHLENGLLHVDLVRRVPEALKPRRIEISAPPAPPASGQRALEGALATAAD